MALNSGFMALASFGAVRSRVRDRPYRQPADSNSAPKTLRTFPMTQHCQDLLFNPAVRDAQEAHGSTGYPVRPAIGKPDRLTELLAALADK
jgi:hypothetical protein